ncbi:hypothetical protein BDC45DRAFT_575995 [Circinella umbellata]|nr:hypothetical protein BDC45DRAFT_575995 [Circinella umbellata]
MSSKISMNDQLWSQFKEVFSKYLEFEKNTVSLKGFHLYDPQSIVTHSKRVDVKTTWNFLFKKMLEEYEVQSMQDPVVLNQNQQIMTIVTLYFTFDKDFNKQQPSWDVILQELLERSSPPSISGDVKSHSEASSSTDRKNSKPSCSSDSSSSTGLWESFEEKYRSMDNNSKWKLGDNNLDDAWKLADESRFDPVRQFDADCAKRTVLNVLAGYRWDTINRIERNGKKRDVMRLWRAIDDSFDDLKADVFRSDQLSSSSSSRHNEEQNATDGSIKQKVVGAKPDLIISKNMNGVIKCPFCLAPLSNPSVPMTQAVKKEYDEYLGKNEAFKNKWQKQMEMFLSVTVVELLNDELP